MEKRIKKFCLIFYVFSDNEKEEEEEEEDTQTEKEEL